MKALRQNTHELDCYLDRREPGWNDLADRAREKGLEESLCKGLVSKTKAVTIEGPCREDWSLGGKIGDGRIGDSKVSEQRTSPCPVEL